LKLEAKCILFI